MELLAGTSGFSYKEWKGSFYPEKLANADMLRFYAERLSAVELNNTFYRMPRTHVLENWLDQVGEGFRFSVKASRRITHIKRLKGVEDETEYLFSKLTTLGPQLGVVLFQLPPHARKNLERLQTFLELLPDGTPVTFEFRHESWFDDDVFDALRSRNCSLCLADNDGDEPWLTSTADWGYLRLRRTEYSDAALKEWRQRIDAEGWTRTYVFFKHEDAGAGPALATRFLGLKT